MGAILLSDAVEAQWGAAITQAAPGRPHVVLAGDALRGDPADVEIAFFSGDLYPARTRPFWRALRDCPRLRWLHSFSAGVDHPVFARVAERGVRLTTSSGANAVTVAEGVVMSILALARHLPRFLDAQRRHAWQPRDVDGLEEAVLGVLGLGPIGLAVARLGAAFGMRVIGVRRRPTGDEGCETWPLARLDELLPLVDWLVLALPLTAETRAIVDARALARLRPSARLVNVGRGKLVDEGALIEALTAGRLAGAALDVFAVEPLPPESPLWDLPNVLVTPHVAGSDPANEARVAAMFLDNLARYERGEPLLNEIER
jgi:phosphoglycerate dehydrogenase-like enzyme